MKVWPVNCGKNTECMLKEWSKKKKGKEGNHRRKGDQSEADDWKGCDAESKGER